MQSISASCEGVANVLAAQKHFLIAKARQIRGLDEPGFNGRREHGLMPVRQVFLQTSPASSRKISERYFSGPLGMPDDTPLRPLHRFPWHPRDLSPVPIARHYLLNQLRRDLIAFNGKGVISIFDVDGIRSLEIILDRDFRLLGKVLQILDDWLPHSIPQNSEALCSR